MADIPRAVLSESLMDKIRGRKVRAGVFLTYEFDPEFFELHVLPCLFDRAFSHVDNVRRLQLEDALREVDHLAVYYDRRALVEAGSARLDYRRIAVSRPGGVFHAKNVLLVVEDRSGETPVQSLLVVTTSANLTRNGWWKNVECAHIEEIPQASKTVLRDDLLTSALGGRGLLAAVRDADRTGTSHDPIREFLVRRTEGSKLLSKGGVLMPTFYSGGLGLPRFLARCLPQEATRGAYCLEVISPFFDETGGAETLQALLEEIRPRQTRIFLPREDDGTVLCSEEIYHAVAALPGVSWADLPRPVVAWKESDTKAGLRSVHAKAYRLFSPDEQREFLLTGSPNLTRAGHAGNDRGNFETAILVEVPCHRRPEWWLQTRADSKPPAFRPRRDEDSEEGLRVHGVHVRYEWGEERLSYFWEPEEPTPVEAGIGCLGVPLFQISPIRLGEWTALPGDAANALRERLVSTSFVEVEVPGEPPQRILVREEGMARKPSLETRLSPREILEYWSLLSSDERDAFLQRKVEALLALAASGGEGPATPPSEEPDSLFDRFAGIFHAFSLLREHVLAALEDGREREADYRLFGTKYDSLPSYLEKTRADPGTDPVMCYVGFLCARDLVRAVERAHPEFVGRRRAELGRLEELLRKGDEVRDGIPLDGRWGGADRGRFIEWYEEMFLAEAPLPATEAP